MAVEIMPHAANLAFIALAKSAGSRHGQVIVFLHITVAAAEAAVGAGHHAAWFPAEKVD